MSDAKKSEGDPRFVIALIAAVICAFAGYDVGQWPGALTAAAVAFGGIYMLFAAIVLGLKLAVGGVVLLLMIAALKNRWDWLVEVFN